MCLGSVYSELIVIKTCFIERRPRQEGTNGIKTKDLLISLGVSNVTYNFYKNALLLICIMWKGEMGRTQIYWLTRDTTVYNKKLTWMMTIISMAFCDYIRVNLVRKSVYNKQNDPNRSNNSNWIFCYYSGQI